VTATAAPRDDSDLLAKLQQGDEAAFATLIARHHAALRRAALAFVSTPASADEVVQDTWVAVIAGLRSFEGRCSLKTWIFQILVNRAKTKGVREARVVPVSAIAGGPEDEAPGAVPEHVDAETPKKLLLRKELAGELKAAMLDLPARQRTVVMLRDALGWSPRDVCDVLSVNEANQRVLLHRARVRLRANLWHHRAAG
jgi:RNA polymerase sigma-70 factor, ECF subfamily